jgi:hypothetical protein
MEPDFAAGVQEDAAPPHIDAGMVGEDLARIPQPKRAVAACAEPDP